MSELPPMCAKPLEQARNARVALPYPVLTGGSDAKGRSAMHSLFYIIGVVVAALLVINLIS
ncbi:MAG: hypothetical protein CFE34_15110 [Rhodobacteraceae bacterium PARR1]|nr:MAG: hypothetical protein CFE34_15110 [Rhodobacteraceae bacterium PARR1]